MIAGHAKTSKTMVITVSRAEIVLAYCALGLNPLVSAFVTILLRTMKGISHHTAAFYLSILQLVVFGTIIGILGVGPYVYTV